MAKTFGSPTQDTLQPSVEAPKETLPEGAPKPYFGKKKVAEVLPQGYPESPDFLLQAHPGRVTVIFPEPNALGVVVPMFGKLKLIGGVSNYDQTRDNVERVSQNAEGRGWVVIPKSIRGEGTSYTRKVGGSHFLEWEKIEPGAPAPIADNKAYAKFCEWLYAAGVLPRPARWVLEREKSKAMTVLGSLSQAQQNPMVASEMRHWEKVIATYDDYLGRA